MSVLLTGRNPIKTTVTKTVTETITAYPSSYDTSSYSYQSVSGADNPIGKGSTNTTYATIYLKTGSNAASFMYYYFDFSSIPENADILSVSCKAKASISTTSTNYIKLATMGLLKYRTLKGNTVSYTTSATTQTIDCGTWTRDELQECTIQIGAQRGNTSPSTSRYIRFYGAEVTVTYTYEVEEEVWV